MKNLDSIAKDLFNKIRGRFPNITLGDKEGNVTNIPSNARYFDFAFLDEKEKKISVSLEQDNGIVVIVGKDIVGNQPEHIQDKWYNFLKELRVFSKKRLLNFDVRDINKSILNKRDYKFLAATRLGDETMAESKMYGTNKTSYQRIGNARLAIKHTHPINLESTGSRSQKIKAIYVESPEGERFKYPYNHVAGARAMARHVSEGGNAYDDFGKYISGLSNEASKLQKFKKYMNRSSVMAETLSGYMDTVNTRIQEVKKEIIHLQKEGFYKQAIENFTVPVVEDVPEGVSENWIDQLTIKQFNEELKDVFPYIYKLIGEATKVKVLGPEDLDETDLDTDETNEAGGIGGGISGRKFSKGANYAPAVGAGVRGAVDNFTMGGGNYVRAAADYGIKNLGSLVGMNDPTTWDKEIGQEREKDIAAQRDYPVAWDIGDKAATVAQVASGVGAGKVLAAKAARAAAANIAAKTAAKKTAADLKYQAMGMSNAELANAMKISKSPELARELQRRLALQKMPNLPVPKPLNLTPQMRTTPTSTLKLTPQMRTTPTSEEFEIEQAFEDIMGQFSDHVCEDCGNPSWRTLSEEKQKGVDGKVCWKGYKRMGTKMKGGKRVDNCVKVSEATPNNSSYSGMNDNELDAAYAMHKNQARISNLSNKKGQAYTHQLAMSEIDAERKRRVKPDGTGQFREDTAQLTDVTEEDKAGYGTVYMRFVPKKADKETYLSAFANFANEPTDVNAGNSLRQYYDLSTKNDIANTVKKIITDKVFLNAKNVVLYKEPGVVNRFDQLKDFFEWMNTYKGDKIKVVDAPEKDQNKPEKDNTLSVEVYLPKVKKTIKVGRGSIQSDRTDDRLKTGDMVRITSGEFAGYTGSVQQINYNKEKEKGSANPYANVDKRVVKAPEPKMTRYFKLGNTRLFNFLRKERPDLMQQYFRPNFGGFVMNDKSFKEFLKLANSSEFGDPQIQIDQTRSFFEDTGVDEGIKGKLAMLALLGLTGMGAMKAIDPSNSPLGQALQSAAEQGDEDAAMHLRNLGAYIDGNDTQTLKMLNFQYVDEPASMKDDATIPNDSTSSTLSKTQKTPLGEFILSYFDRETGRFPKGETAVLTAVQKDYGDQYVKPAVEFIKKVEATTAKKQVEKIQNSLHPETEMIKHLAGV